MARAAQDLDREWDRIATGPLARRTVIRWANTHEALAGLVEGSLHSGGDANSGSSGSTCLRYVASAFAPLKQTARIFGCARKKSPKSFTTIEDSTMSLSRLLVRVHDLSTSQSAIRCPQRLSVRSRYESAASMPTTSSMSFQKLFRGCA